MRRILPLSVSIVSLLPSVLLAQQVDVPLRNWTVPPYTRAAAAGGLTTMTDVTPPRVFVGVAPCRIADTRGLGFSGQAGPPAINTGTRTFQISGTVAGVPAQCGIPNGAEAVSFQFTIVSPNAAGNLIAWPAGGALPSISVLNWDAGITALGNGTIVPLADAGGLSVRINAAVGGATAHLVIDVNGYFSDVFQNPANYLEIHNNSPGYVFRGSNSSTTCSGPCGISVDVSSGHAIYGTTSVTAGATYGVFGGSNANNGGAAGVYGNASQGSASGGIFHNNGLGQMAGTAEVHLASTFESTSYALATFNHIAAGSLQIFGGKMFVSPHPEDPSRQIQYASVEAPTVDVYFRGTAALVNGSLRIDVPEHFRLTARDGTYMTMLTPLDRAVALRVEHESAAGILVRGTGNTRFHYVVYAERDAIVDFDPMPPNEVFRPEFLERLGGPDRLPAATRALLVKNGTIRPDGTYNPETIRANGWTLPERAVPATPPQP